MLKADHIHKNFGTRIALDDVSLTLEPGHIFGLLGTNGAGKSTLLRILSGLYRPDHGKITLDDAPVLETSSSKRAICYLSDEPAFLMNASISEMGVSKRPFIPITATTNWQSCACASRCRCMNVSPAFPRALKNGLRFVLVWPAIREFSCAMKPLTVSIPLCGKASSVFSVRRPATAD